MVHDVSVPATRKVASSAVGASERVKQREEVASPAADAEAAAENLSRCLAALQRRACQFKSSRAKVYIAASVYSAASVPGITISLWAFNLRMHYQAPDQAHGRLSGGAQTMTTPTPLPISARGRLSNSRLISSSAETFPLALFPPAAPLLGASPMRALRCATTGSKSTSPARLPMPPQTGCTRQFCTSVEMEGYV